MPHNLSDSLRIGPPGNASASLWPNTAPNGMGISSVSPAAAPLPRVAANSSPALARVLSAAQQREVGEKPPPGCDADAIKLFVGNIPRVSV